MLLFILVMAFFKNAVPMESEARKILPPNTIRFIPKSSISRAYMYILMNKINRKLNWHRKEYAEMKNAHKSLLLCTLILTILLSPFKVYGMPHQQPSKLPCNTKTVALINAERKLWSDHVFWTRNFVISDFASLEDKDAVLQRLLQNQDDIGNSIKPYYGEKAGNELSKLLREHIVLAGQVIDAAKTGNKTNLDKYNKLWYKNADDIAVFLSKANPHWPFKTIQSMMYKHLQLLTDAAVSRLHKDWKKDITFYDLGEDHMLMFADILSQGIIKQFPNTFK